MKIYCFRLLVLRLVAFSILLLVFVPFGAAVAGPWVTTGDSALRSDIQILADAGHIMSPTMVWPMSWGDIMAGLDDTKGDWSAVELAALTRVQKRMREETQTGYLRLTAHAAVAENPIQIRTFEDTPREKGEVGIGLEYTGNWWAMNLQGQWIDDPFDGDEWRADGSYLGIALGNWMLSAAAMDRWWGPGWQGSLILGNNARPIPAITLERNLTTPFETKWLSWIGNWDLSIMYGLLEKERVVPEAHYFAMRLDFRPTKNLQVGLSRAALWCGDGQPCDADAFIDVLFRGDNGDSDPNQLGGFDLRWSGKAWTVPYALYTQWIGEDYANFFPTAWLGLFGGEVWGFSDSIGTWRTYLEWSDTECGFRFYNSVRGDDDRRPGCAYNHQTYQTGYRYKGRAIGHSFDGDSSVFTLGGTLSTRADNAWVASMAIGNLNRRSARPSTTAQNKTRYRAINLTHRRPLWVGELQAGLGYDYRKDTVTGNKIDDFQFFLEYSLRL
jgi:hypothetical protein